MQILSASFQAFSLCVLSALLNGFALPTVFLPVRSRNECCAADDTMLFVHRIHYFHIQFVVFRKYGIFEAIAINSVFADKLDAGMFLAIIKQQAIAVITVAAEPAHKSADFLALFQRNFDYHSCPSSRMNSHPDFGPVIALITLPQLESSKNKPRLQKFFLNSQPQYFHLKPKPFLKRSFHCTIATFERKNDTHFEIFLSYYPNVVFICLPRNLTATLLCSFPFGKSSQSHISIGCLFRCQGLIFMPLTHLDKRLNLHTLF